MIASATAGPDSVSPTQIERLKQRLGEFEGVYQHMRTRAPAMQRYATLWPRYVRTMNDAAQFRARVQAMAGLADDGYHYAQALFGRENAQAGLGELGALPTAAYLMWTAGIGVLGLLSWKTANMVEMAKCQESADKIKARNPGMNDEQALKLACPHLYEQPWQESFVSIAKWGALIVGGIYLINRVHAKSEADKRRARLKQKAADNIFSRYR